MIFNKKNFFIFCFFSLTQLFAADASEHPTTCSNVTSSGIPVPPISALLDDDDATPPPLPNEVASNYSLLEKLNPGDLTFKNYQLYIEYTKEIGLPQTLIVGAGRGKSHPISKINHYDQVAYEKPHNYFLVDLNPEFKPDLCLSILNLSPELCGGNYRYVIFENVNMDYSFTPKAMEAAFSILAPGGSIISSGIPNICGKDFIPEEINENDSSIKQFNFIGGEYFYKEGNEGQQLLGNSIYCDAVSGADNSILSYHSSAAHIDFYSKNSANFMMFLGLSPNEADIKFKYIYCDFEKWPRKDNEILFREYGHRMIFPFGKILMIITKKQ
ncbi:MAG: hypothetical protein LBB12_02360 [Holosporaceae bacterium]|jgi:hypothetical protein|nr:hypothetical protein [Holosporaceae bacterium]